MELEATLRGLRLAGLSKMCSLPCIFWIPPSCNVFLPLLRSPLQFNWEDALENRNYFMEVTFSSSQSQLNWGLETMAISVRLRDVASSCLWWKNLQERQNESGNSLIPCGYQREGIRRTMKCWCPRYAGGCNIRLKIWSSGFVSKSSTSSLSRYLECLYPYNSFRQSCKSFTLHRFIS